MIVHNRPSENVIIPSETLTDNGRGHLSSMVTCQICLAVVTELEKHRNEGKVVMLAMARQLCNKMLILALPCNLVIGYAIDKAYDKIMDNATPDTVCASILHICSNDLNEMLAIMDTLDKNLIHYDEKKTVFAARHYIVTPDEVIGDIGLTSVEFDEAFVSTTFAHASSYYPFLAKYGLIANSRSCGECHGMMTLIQESSTDTAFWKCGPCRKESKTVKKSVREGSYFAVTKLKMIDFFKVHYFWSLKPTATFQEYTKKSSNSNVALKKLLDSKCDNLSDWNVSLYKPSIWSKYGAKTPASFGALYGEAKIGGDDITVEVILDKQFLGDPGEEERQFQYIVSAVTWESPPKVIICPTPYPSTVMAKNDILDCMINNLRDGSKVVAPESFFDTIGGAKEFCKDLEAFAFTRQRINIKCKTIESLTRLSASNTAFVQLRKDLATTTSSKTSVCPTYLYRYFFYRYYPSSRLNNFLRIITELYTF